MVFSLSGSACDICSLVEAALYRATHGLLSLTRTVLFFHYQRLGSMKDRHLPNFLSLKPHLPSISSRLKTSALLVMIYFKGFRLHHFSC